MDIHFALQIVRIIALGQNTLGGLDLYETPAAIFKKTLVLV